MKKVLPKAKKIPSLKAQQKSKQILEKLMKSFEHDREKANKEILRCNIGL